MTTLEQQWSNAAGILVTMITTYGLRAIGAIIILIAGWMMAHWSWALVTRALQRARRIDATVALFLANFVRYGIIAMTFIAVLTTFGVATTSFVAVLGAMGLAIGLALQGTLSQLTAGIMLVLFRPFHVGDTIETGGVSGTTRMINLFYTEIDTADNVRVIVPNGKLWGEIVKVYTRNEQRRLDLRLQMPRDENVAASLTAVRDLIQKDRRVRGTPTVGVEALNDGGFVVLAQLWVDSGDYQAVQFDLNRILREELQRREGARKAA
jgi:small conductance mechanosensitive channel